MQQTDHIYNIYLTSLVMKILRFNDMINLILPKYILPNIKHIHFLTFSFFHENITFELSFLLQKLTVDNLTTTQTSQ